MWHRMDYTKIKQLAQTTFRIQEIHRGFVDLIYMVSCLWMTSRLTRARRVSGIPQHLKWLHQEKKQASRLRLFKRKLPEKTNDFWHVRTIQRPGIILILNLPGTPAVALIQQPTWILAWEEQAYFSHILESNFFTWWLMHSAIPQKL